MWDDNETTVAPANNYAGNGYQNSSSSGFYVGRGRGFGNMSSMTASLPEVGRQTSGSQSNQCDDDLWDEGGSSNQNNNSSPWENKQSSWQSNSNGYQSSRPNRDGGGGSRACFKCNEEGHMSRDCPKAGSGGGSRACFKCNEEGHMSRDCPNAGSGGGGSRACFKCNEEGHMSRDCPNAGSGGGGSRACFKCNEEGHMSRDCPNGGSGGGGSRACFKCNEEGHMSRDCPNAGSGGGGGSRACFKCNEEGHMSRDCPNAGSGGGGGSRACFKCNEEGHMSRDCPNAGSGGGGGSRACFKCNEEGHMSRDCPNADSSDKPRSNACFKCQEEGHMAKDCTKEVLGPDGKPRPPLYIPPDPTEDEDTLFQGVPTGINFSKYDAIHVDVTGPNPVPPIDSFENSGLNKHLCKNIEHSKYTKPTPVQKYAIPIIMAKRDLMASAQTGSGKTAAFLLPMLNEMITNSDLPNNANNFCQEPWAVIVAPTRELVIQIGSEARKFAFDSVINCDVLYGGTSTSYQTNRLKKGCHLLTATPGRLLDFLEKGKVSFASLRYFVLDEADRMLDMGFVPDIRKMVEHESMPKKGIRQTLMFSATFPQEIQDMAADFLNDYLFLTVGMVGAANSDVEQVFFNLGQFDKRQKLIEILKESEGDRTLVFVAQKRAVDFLASWCSQQNIPATSIHGDRLQKEREEALADFRSGQMCVLIATAVAARGLDIRDVRHVINFDLPQTIDEYVHRIGRTGRVGNLGKATSFYNAETDKPLTRALVKILTDAQQPVPEWLVEEANQSTDTMQYGGRGNFGSRDVRRNRAPNIDSNDAFDNNQSSFGNSVAEEDSWD